jgi:hypothetical protein
MVVFPSRDSDDIMNQPGWYLVRLSFPSGSRAAIAHPIIDRTLVEVSRDLTDVFMTN